MIGKLSHTAVAMQAFDVYLFDELGQLMQQIPIEVTSEDAARERALYLQKTQRATAYRLMPFDIRPRHAADFHREG
jgi:hypothetical protein